MLWIEMMKNQKLLCVCVCVCVSVKDRNSSVLLLCCSSTEAGLHSAECEADVGFSYSHILRDAYRRSLPKSLHTLSVSHRTPETGSFVQRPIWNTQAPALSGLGTEGASDAHVFKRSRDMEQEERELWGQQKFKQKLESDKRNTHTHTSI